MCPEPRRTPDYLLELAAAGDLAEEERRALLDAVEAEPGGAERLAALARDDAETRARLPARAFAATVAARTGARATPRAAWFAVPTAAVAAALLFVLRAGPGPVPAEPPDVTRVKGFAPAVVVHRARGGGEERLSPGARARPGDVIQLGYVAAGRRFGAIVSLDGRGHVTRHWPTSGPTAAPLSPRGETLLPDAFRLDDAPGFERFLLVTSDAPFPVEAAIVAARAVAGLPDPGRAALPLPPGLAASSALILKVTP